MIRINCRTNLDLHHSEQFPKLLPEVPKVGQHIESFSKMNNFRLVLEVVRVTWRVGVYKDEIVYSPEVELHLPKSAWSTRSLRDFYEWYAPQRGLAASYFI